MKSLTLITAQSLHRLLKKIPAAFWFLFYKDKAELMYRIQCEMDQHTEDRAELIHVTARQLESPTSGTRVTISRGTAVLLPRGTGCPIGRTCTRCWFKPAERVNSRLGPRMKMLFFHLIPLEFQHNY